MRRNRYGQRADRWYSDYRVCRWLAWVLVCRRKDHDWFEMGSVMRRCKRCKTPDWTADKHGWF